MLLIILLLFLASNQPFYRPNFLYSLSTKRIKKVGAQGFKGGRSLLYVEGLSLLSPITLGLIDISKLVLANLSKTD
ncbi:hypothetical protein D5F74_08980 [Oenococcus oeni]|nr:hypothetical protein D5F74_08980 [Oenococcus oeni]